MEMCGVKTVKVGANRSGEANCSSVWGRGGGEGWRVGGQGGRGWRDGEVWGWSWVGGQLEGRVGWGVEWTLWRGRAGWRPPDQTEQFANYQTKIRTVLLDLGKERHGDP